VPARLAALVRLKVDAAPVVVGVGLAWLLFMG